MLVYLAGALLSTIAATSILLAAFHARLTPSSKRRYKQKMRPKRISTRNEIVNICQRLSAAEGGLELSLDAFGLESVVLDCRDVLEKLMIAGVLDMSEAAGYLTTAIPVVAAMVGLASKNMLMKRVRCSGVMLVVNPRLIKNAKEEESGNDK